MFLAAVIVSFVLGVVFTLLAQLWISRRWLSYQPQLFPPYRQQHEKADLPPVLRRSVCGIQGHQGSKSDLGSRSLTTAAKNIPEERKSSKTILDDKRGSKAVQDEKRGDQSIPDEKKNDQSLILNVLFQFLFAELKDTARVRRWAARKMNAEFEEMLASTTGKLMNQIQVRDFNFGSSFPLVESVKLRNVELSNDEDIIQTVDVELNIDYEGGFQLTLDVDIIFGAWAYLSISVTKLAGQGRLQLTRVPFTHWSFSFYEEPRMEFNVDSRFNGRPIPQISSLIVNQIKRTIRKKHVLPSYKMRYKPLFTKPEESFINPDICFHGHKLGPGKLSVKVLKCSRLQELSPESKLFCTLSVDKEEIEEVWRQSWVTLDMILKIYPQQSASGLNLKDQLSGDKTEKKRVVVDSIAPDSPAAEAGLKRGDIVETVGNVRVLSIKHAMKQLKNSTESVTIRVKRQSRLALDPNPYLEQEDMEFEEQEMNDDIQGEMGDFVNIDFKQRSSSLNTEVQPSQESVKFSEKLSRKLQSGKKKILGLKDNDKDRESVPETKSLLAEEDYALQTDKNFIDNTPVASYLRDGSQSAKSSPQKQALEISRQRAHSDTSLNRAQTGDGDTVSASSDVGSYSYQELQRRKGEVATREVTFSSNAEWNEEFEFDCKEEDQYVNVCVWCKMAQTDRASKNMSATTSRADTQQPKNTPPTDDLPSFDLTTKIGYVSVPLADITAGCLLTMQGDTQYTMYLHPPEETITASRTKLPYSGHIGFDKNICHGDITLSFVHKPFKTVEPVARKEIIKDVLDPPAVKVRAKSLERERSEGQHSFRGCQFTTKTYCDFCGKKIWLKGGLKCSICKMVCHKKCVEKCNIQTKCSREGPKMSSKPEESWVPPLKGQEMEKEEGKTMTKFWKFRQKDQPSLALNIPYKSNPNRTQASSSPSRSPVRSPSPFSSLSEHVDRHLSVAGMKKTFSNKSLPGMDDDSDDEVRYRNPTYSLDDNVVIEAKEKGKELHANLSLPDRKKTLDEMVTKLQDTIDRESEYKSEMMKNYQELTDTDLRRHASQQLEKCDEKIEALMMMMVHYCAGLQHCLDQEEAHKRMLNMEPANDDEDDLVTEDAGIQFVVTDS